MDRWSRQPTNSRPASPSRTGRSLRWGPRTCFPLPKGTSTHRANTCCPAPSTPTSTSTPRKCDDWTTGPITAAHGGITTLIAFAIYNDQEGETLPQSIEQTREEAEARSTLDFAFHYILHNQPYILDGIPKAFEMGVTSYKMFMTYKARQYRMCSDDFICQAMEIISKHGGITQLHCENGDILDYLENKFISEGQVHPRYYPHACPPWAEEEAINRAVKMGAMTNCPTYVVHLSTKLGLERIKEAQRHRPAGVDRDLPSVPAPLRCGYGKVGASRQDRPSSPPCGGARSGGDVEWYGDG